MANLHISDELDQHLQQTAERLGCSKESLVTDALWSRADFVEAPLTDAEIERMRQSIVQLDRGEYVTSEQVEERFAGIFRKLDAR